MLWELIRTWTEDASLLVLFCQAMRLDALEKICYESDLSKQRHDVPSVKKANGEMGRGGLLFKDANVGGHRDLIIDIAFTQRQPLCGRGPQRAAARPRCQQAPRDHGTHQGGAVPRGICQPGTTYALLPCAMSTSGGIQGGSCASSTSLPTGAP